MGAYPDRPRVAVGGVVIHDGRVLLVRRDRAPSRGQWAIPGGRVELGETLAQAAEREVLEETGVVVRAGGICYTFESITHDDAGRVQYHYVIIDLLAEYVSGSVKAASDASDAAWLTPSDLAALPANDNTRELLTKLGFIDKGEHDC